MFHVEHLRVSVVTSAAMSTWQYRVNTTINDPGNGNVRFNNLTLPSATSLAVSNKAQGLEDVTDRIARLVPGDMIVLQATLNAAKWVNYRIAAIAVMQSTWSTVSVVNTSASATPTFADAEQVTLRLLTELSPSETDGLSDQELADRAAIAVLPTILLNDFRDGGDFNGAAGKAFKLGAAMIAARKQMLAEINASLKRLEIELHEGEP